MYCDLQLSQAAPEHWDLNTMLTQFTKMLSSCFVCRVYQSIFSLILQRHSLTNKYLITCGHSIKYSAQDGRTIMKNLDCCSFCSSHLKTLTIYLMGVHHDKNTDFIDVAGFDV